MEKTIEQIKEENEKLEIENAQLKAELGVLKTGNAELEKRFESFLLAKPAVATGTKETFELEGRTYEVQVGKVFILGLGYRTALEVASDPEAQAYLIQIESGLIKEIKN